MKQCRLLIGVILLVSFVSLYAVDSPWVRYKKQSLRLQKNILGFCSTAQAAFIMDILYILQPKVCVEIGTYCGSTTLPIVRALSFLGRGKLYTIDAWDNKAAIAGLADDLTKEFWATVDLVNLKRNFLIWMDISQSKGWCTVLHMTSEKASGQFADESIDLVYIDGNFSSEGSLLDVTTYLPKVKQGGYIWLNDADDERKSSSVQYLKEHCTYIPEYSLQNNLLLFRK